MAAPTVPLHKMRPNDPCCCGSGQKFKRCHRPSLDRVRPAAISPQRPVPDEIVRPHYAEHGGTDDRSEPMVKDPETIEAMRRTGRAAGEILRQVGEAIAPGVTTDELDELTHRLCIEAGGYPSYEFHWTVSDLIQAMLRAGCRLVEAAEFGTHVGDWEGAPLEGLPEWLLLVGRKELY